MAKPNYPALVKYLAQFDLDANRIPIDSLSREGFDYFPDAATTPVRLGTDMRIPREPHEWPEAGMFEEVMRLYNGGGTELPKDEPLQEGELVKPDPEVKAQAPKQARKK